MTLRELLDMWMQGPVRHYKESSRMIYRIAVEKHIIPELGEYQLQELNRPILQSWLETMKRRGLSEKTVREINAKLTAALQWGVEQGMLEHCAFCVKLKVPLQKQVILLTKEEQQRLERYFLDSQKVVVLGIGLCLFCGLTSAELCALKWEDLDLEKGTVTVKRVMQRLTGGNGGKRTCLKLLPQAERTVAIPGELSSKLWRIRQDGECFFLTGRTEKWIEPRLLQNRWKQICLECGLADCLTLGSLRATFIARGFEEGMTPAQMGELTGKRDQGRLWKRYAPNDGVGVQYSPLQ